VEVQKESFKKKLQDRQNGGSEAFAARYTSSHRCPALVDLFSRGFVVTAHRDFFIATTGDIDDPQVVSNPGVTYNEQFFRSKLSPDGGSLGDPPPFARDSLLGIQRPYPERTPNLIFKVQTPWLVKTPDDTVLLMMGVPLSDNNDFTVVSGILDPQLDSIVMVLLWWHHHDRPDIILKKGTPLAQLIPIPRQMASDKFEMVLDPDLINRQICLNKEIHYLQSTQRVANYKRIGSLVSEFERMENSQVKSKCPFSSSWKR